MPYFETVLERKGAKGIAAFWCLISRIKEKKPDLRMKLQTEDRNDSNYIQSIIEID